MLVFTIALKLYLGVIVFVSSFWFLVFIKMNSKKYFQEKWLDEPLFKDWFPKGIKDKTKACCAVCHESFELSSSGRSAITDHGKGKKHLKELRKVNSFLLPPKKRKMSQIMNHKSVLWRRQRRYLQVNRHWTLVLIYPML